MEVNGGPPWLSMIVMTRQKPSATPPQKDPLAEFLSDPESRKLSTAEFVSRGVTHVTERHLDRLVPRLHALRERIAKINDSPLLQSRLLVFADFLAATHHGPEAAQPARREAAFALAYFFEGSDRIPDGTPLYGLLDDALVVQDVLQRVEPALRAHAQRHQLTLPDPL